VVLLVAANFSSPFKGTQLGIEALKRLGGMTGGGGGGGGDVTVLIAGAREEGADWAGVPRPVFAGFIGDEGRLAQAYRAADVTLMPSVADNFPYVALESLACGTPLATFRIGGLTEIVGADEADGGRRGLAASPFDTGELAGNIAAILGDADRRRALGDAGRRWVKENCSMDAFVAANLAVYREAVDRWRGDGGNGGRAPSRVQAAPVGAPDGEGRP
jgi:glycosyltransferase involved in cell wall biosynthesis